MNYGEKICRLRKSKGMTQEELGKVLNVTYQAVSKWERGESLPDFETMSQIAKYFQVPLGYFEDGGESRPAPAPAETSFIGTCTECGKLLKDDEAFTTSPKIICKNCADRLHNEAARRKNEEEQRLKREAEHRRKVACGRGFDLKLGISLVLALACYVLFTVLSLTSKTGDSELFGALLFLIPLAVFGCTHALADFINDLRDRDDDCDGYTRNLSLIIAGVFAAVNLAVFLVLYLNFNQGYYLVMLALGVVLSFTFVSQFAWGGVIKEIFTAGGFTFRLPGFIFTLDIDSILFMFIAKFFLGILSVLVFVVTTVILAVVAIIGSIIIFIPSIIAKSVNDKRA